MVSIKSLLATAAAAALPMSSAYITGMTAPASAKAGDKISATLTAAIYIQNWEDYGIVWGLADARMNCGDIVCVGRRFDYTPLFPDHVPQPGDFSIDLTIPSDYDAGDYHLVAAVPYLVGASGETLVQGHSANITITA
ncbi:hypothetical protein M426DRAFT_325989 [Hypoxylon sp. CI-4A]|nr:hypothetical protein M426DRAFT_325989 [Hypoxylon sp. CI-4A]